MKADIFVVRFLSNFSYIYIYKFYLKERNVKFLENKKKSAPPPLKRKINFAHNF